MKYSLSLMDNANLNSKKISIFLIICAMCVT